VQRFTQQFSADFFGRSRRVALLRLVHLVAGRVFSSDTSLRTVTTGNSEIQHDAMSLDPPTYTWKELSGSSSSGAGAVYTWGGRIKKRPVGGCGELKSATLTSTAARAKKNVSLSTRKDLRVRALSTSQFRDQAIANGGGLDQKNTAFV